MKISPAVKIILASTIVLLASFAQAETYVEGKDYRVISKPGIPTTPGKIEVREFFWYGCPHCYKLETVIAPWKKTLPQDVEFVATPAAAAPHWRVLASAYFAADNLNITDKSHTAMFNAIHREKRSMNTPGQVAKFYSQFGVTEQEVKDQMESFSAKTALRKSESLFRQYQLTGVPAVIVNGKYQPTSKNYSEMLKVAEFLIEKERKAMLTQTK